VRYIAIVIAVLCGRKAIYLIRIPPTLERALQLLGDWGVYLLTAFENRMIQTTRQPGKTPSSQSFLC
jgi:hypothetical protein